MPYKDKTRYRRYMRDYMRDYRAWEREIIKRAKQELNITPRRRKKKG